VLLLSMLVLACVLPGVSGEAQAVVLSTYFGGQWLIALSTGCGAL